MMSPYAGGVWIDGRWLAPPFPGAVWVDGYYGEDGEWVGGGWGRPPELPGPVSMDHPEPARWFMLAECERAVMDWLAALHVPHVDDNFVARVAANKPRQLRDAPGFGFTLRPTWLGNDPEEARAFIQRQPGSVIDKALWR